MVNSPINIIWNNLLADVCARFVRFCHRYDIFCRQLHHQTFGKKYLTKNVDKKCWPKLEIQQEASGEQWEFITTLNHRIDDLIRENDTTKENFESINERSKHFFKSNATMKRLCCWETFSPACSLYVSITLILKDVSKCHSGWVTFDCSYAITVV